MVINNTVFNKNCFSCDDIYFFVIGYEHRSYFLYEKILSFFPTIMPIVFVLDDYEKYPHAVKLIDEIKEKKGVVYVNSYTDFTKVQQTLIDVIKDRIAKNDSTTIHIDYSSMPRSWYCKLPILLEKILKKEDTVYFWYSEGKYPSSYKEYPSAGIDSFSMFSGKPSLRTDNNRIHILGLGYDVIRSQAILSITDPNFLVSCYAYNLKREGFLDNLQAVNSPIFSRSAMTLAFHVDDFEFMVSKLCETANELLPCGDVILIPDGPKPLIFAISLVPDLVKKSGLTCLHISRNSEFFEAVDVEATGTVYGFSIHGCMYK